MNERDDKVLRLLAAQRGLRASDELRARLRAGLLSAPVAFTAPSRRPVWWRQLAGVALALAIVAAGSGAAAASSLPGEPAFVLKQVFEEVQLALAPDEATRASVAVEIAERRLAELQRTQGRPELAGPAAAAYEHAAARVSKHVDRLRTAPAAPARDEALERARDAGTRAVERLHELEETLPEPAQKGIERAIEVHEEQQHRDAGPNAPARTPKPERTPKPSDNPGRGPGTTPRR
ncbi:MAG TPA: DUF5667 domain-containing protein [Candidatus Limnocylindria bacterium]|nr:DUF5667 domain-containing protein [Candidatus Limnocylindria bacterium]